MNQHALPRTPRFDGPLPRHVALLLGSPTTTQPCTCVLGLRQLALTALDHGVEQLSVGGCALGEVNAGHRVTPELRALSRFCELAQRDFVAADIRVQTLGEVDELASTVRRALAGLAHATSACRSMTLTLTVSHAGRSAMVDAARALAARVKAGELLPEAIDHELFRVELGTNRMPSVDLLLVTAGARRSIDFLPFETGLAEPVAVAQSCSRFDARHLAAAIGLFVRRGPTRVQGNLRVLRELEAERIGACMPAAADAE